MSDWTKTVSLHDAKIRDLEADLAFVKASYDKYVNATAAENERLKALLARWVDDADNGKLDGVDCALMVESEEV